MNGTKSTQPSPVHLHPAFPSQGKEIMASLAGAPPESLPLPPATFHLASSGQGDKQSGKPGVQELFRSDEVAEKAALNSTE
jgi:hypothetical protein